MNSLSLAKKILFSSAICFFCKIIGLFSHLVLAPNSNITPSFYLDVLNAVVMGVNVYIIESIRKSAQLQKELLESEKMKAASTISAAVAHEIRNPLAAIRGFVQLLSTTQVTEEKKRKYCEICLEELDRAQSIINDYLSFSKPQLGKIERLNLSEEMKYVFSVLNSYASLRDVQMECDIQPDLIVTGDRQKFRQSMINLAKNGIESMDKGGVLQINVRKLNQEVHIFISDTGCGMTTDQIERLGTPYYSTKDKGTGLGTMVSLSIIKSMNGKVNVSSQLGIGTVFDVMIPPAGSGED